LSIDNLYRYRPFILQTITNKRLARQKLFYKIIKFMRVRNQTTVVLSEAAQKVKDELAPIFGLKTILSTGLVLLSKLSSDEQKAAIAEANKPNSKSVSSQAELEKILLAFAVQNNIIMSKAKTKQLVKIIEVLMNEPEGEFLKGKELALRAVSGAIAQAQILRQKQKDNRNAQSQST